MPRRRGAGEGFGQAYELAGVEPGTIELVEAHGTGTRVGDAIEVDGPDRSL